MFDSLSESKGSTPFPATTYDKAKYIEFKQQAVEYLGGKCIVCGTVHNLEFDHIDPTTKLFNITDKYTCSFEFIKPELDKCQLLCREDHRQKHKSEFIHGTYHGYSKKKCRCELCRKANAEYSRKIYNKICV